MSEDEVKEPSDPMITDDDVVKLESIANTMRGMRTILREQAEAIDDITELSEALTSEYGGRR